MMNKTYIFITLLFVITVMAFALSNTGYSGGCGPGGAGFICQSPQRGTYWTDTQRAVVEQRGFGGFWTALGERDREMFPNFYRAGGWVGGNVLVPVLGNPYVQKALEVVEQASYGTPGGADDFAFRSLRNLPRVASGLDEASGMATALGTMARRGGEKGKEELRSMIARGEVYLTEPSVFTVREGFEEIITREAFHGSQRVGGYGMSRKGDVLEVSQIWTDPAYQGGHLATEAVAGYIRANPGIRYIAASMEEVHTVRYIEKTLEKGHPNQWIGQALAITPLGKIGAATGATLRPVRLQRQVDFVTESPSPYYDVLVELLR